MLFARSSVPILNALPTTYCTDCLSQTLLKKKEMDNNAQQTSRFLTKIQAMKTKEQLGIPTVTSLLAVCVIYELF